MNKIDDQELQRLLDGVLPPDERALLLQQAEENPSNWRTISLAFVEEQILREELKGFALLDSSVDLHADNTLRLPSIPKLGWSTTLAQAAVVLCMLGAGFWIGRIGNAHNEKTNNGTEQVNYTVVVTPPTQLDPRSTVQESEADKLFEANRLFAPMFDQNARAIFREHGYHVAEEPVVYVVQDQQGKQYVVPHRNVSLVSYGE